MDLSIIIVSWNTRDLLQRCLRSIEERSGPLAVQTIVVDNDSRDGSPQMVSDSFPGVELINSGGNLGFARANNMGLQAASAPLVLFLNPDTEILGDALPRMVSLMRSDQSAGAMGCKLRGQAEETQELGLQWFPSLWTELVRWIAIWPGSERAMRRCLPYWNPDQSGYVEKIYGACLLVREEVLATAGSFDERFFMYCEDVDLCRRIRQAGWKLYYSGDAEILHVGGAASSEAPSAFSTLMSCQSFSILMRKYYGRVGSSAYRLLTLAGSAIRLLYLLCLDLLVRLNPFNAGPRRRGSISKYSSMMQWALGLKQPAVK